MAIKSKLPLEKKVGFIGGGKMAEALVGALVRNNIIPSDRILISDPKEERRTLLEQLFGCRVTSENEEVIKFAEVIFLAIKPQMIEKVLKGVKPSLKTSYLVISIAAGVRISRLSNLMPGARIVRVMPNTPCLVGEMAAGFTAAEDVSKEDIQLVELLLGTAGKVFKLEEDLLDAVTGLSGSGPAFVAHLIEAFIQGGIQEGLPESTARELTLQTFLGTAKLLGEKGLTTKNLIEMVSSPKGTTVAGREILENEPVQDIIKKTISAAADRSRELAES